MDNKKDRQESAPLAPGSLKFMSITEFMKIPRKPNDFHYETIDGREWVTVNWSRNKYDYDIEMNRIRTPLGLLQWIAHMGKKGWPGMTSSEIAAFIESICHNKGWDLWKEKTT